MNFFIYGIIGWCLEIIWTSIYDFKLHGWKLTGKTYLWMFPIYGFSGLFFEKVYSQISLFHWSARAQIWMILIFSIEYLCGQLLKILIGTCPWDYSASKCNIHGVIRLDYAPLWILVGFIFEMAFGWFMMQ